MRSLGAGIALVAAVALAWPAPATAGTANRETEMYVGLSCGAVEATNSTAVVELQVEASTSDVMVDLTYWRPGNNGDEADAFAAYVEPSVLSVDASAISGTIPLVDRRERPAGAASVTAQLTPLGDPDLVNDRHREGNTWVDIDSVAQGRAVSGTLQVGSSTFALDGCWAYTETITSFITSPTAFVAHDAYRTADCELRNQRGDEAYAWFFASRRHVNVEVAAFPVDPRGAFYLGAEGRATGSGFRVALESYDEGQPSPAPAKIEVTYGRHQGRSTTETWRLRGIRTHVTTRAFRLAGTVRVGDATFDLSSCVGTEIRLSEIMTRPLGPKAGGTPPSNDLPSAAKLLAVGESASVWTKGAVAEPEVEFPCVGADPDDPEPWLPGHTVWYTVEGTGDPLTVDTAGSRFDTVVAVYRSLPSGRLDPVNGACVNDTDDGLVEAAVTWDTVKGRLYYVQVGGYPADAFGRVRITIR